jgi:hypothetical protein
MTSYIATGKRNFKLHLEENYKIAVLSIRHASNSSPPTIGAEPSIIKQLLDELVPATQMRIRRANARRDQLFLFLNEPPTAIVGVMYYWRQRESEWP